jgi:ribosome-associated protein
MLKVTESIVLADDELQEKFIIATGPGGQNVNKVATAVQLRFDAAKSPNLPKAVFRRLCVAAGRRMTNDGVLVLMASKYRSQDRNRQDARERLAELIREAAVTPKHRRPTKPTKGSQRRRLDSKRKHSIRKNQRGRVSNDD